jgi:hypothetical protein
MNRSVTTCDLCPASAPSDKSAEHGFSTLTVQGAARAAVLAIPGPGTPHLDLCPDCAKGLTAWLKGHKAELAAKAEAAQHEASTPEPAAVAAGNATIQETH